MRIHQSPTTTVGRGAARALAICFALSLGVGAGSVAASSPSGVSPSTWAWVVARHPSQGSYVPAAKDRGNSAGDVNSIIRTGVGAYNVTLGSVGTSGGIAMITPLASAARLCRVDSWGSSPADETVDVSCYTRSGDPADTAFSLNYLSVTGTSGGTPGRIGYAWADQASATDYTPASTYNYNSDLASPLNTVHSPATGIYDVSFPGLGSSHGTVQVVAYGATVACRVSSWGNEGGTLEARILCRDITGGLVDSLYNVMFLKGVALKGFNGTRSAYLWANRPTSNSYHPAVGYRFSTAGTTPTVTRSGLGRYLVTLPGMPLGGGAQVTSYGPGTARCVASSIRTSGLPQRVGVQCFGVAGNHADAKFTLAYAR